jgi:hypothetical protein
MIGFDSKLFVYRGGQIKEATVNKVKMVGQIAPIRIVLRRLTAILSKEPFERLPCASPYFPDHRTYHVILDYYTGKDVNCEQNRLFENFNTTRNRKQFYA